MLTDTGLQLQETQERTVPMPDYIEKPPETLFAHGEILPTEMLNLLVKPEFHETLVNEILTEPSAQALIIGGHWVNIFANPSIYEDGDVDFIPFGIARDNVMKFREEREDFTIRIAEIERDGRPIEILDHKVMKEQNLTAITELITFYTDKTPKDNDDDAMLKHLTTTKGDIEQADETNLSYHTIFKHEQIGIMLSLDDSGELQGTIHDPMNRLNTQESWIEPTLTQARIAEMEYISTVGFDSLNPSFQVLTTLLDEQEYSPSMEVALSAIADVFRFMRNDCQKGIHLPASLEKDAVLKGYSSSNNTGYALLYLISQKLSTRVQPWFTKESDREFLKVRGYEDEKDWIIKKFQEAFAKSVQTDPTRAIFYATAYLQLGNLLGADIGEHFEDYHNTCPANNTELESVAKIATIFGEEQAKELAESTSNALKTLVNVYLLIDREYETHTVPIQETHPLSEKERGKYSQHLSQLDMQISVINQLIEKGTRYDVMYAAYSDELKQQRERIQARLSNTHPTYHTELIKPPQNISEIYAIIITSMGLDTTKDIEKITRIVNSWRQKGILTKKRVNQEHGFDMNIDLEKVLEYMKRFSSEQ